MQTARLSILILTVIIILIITPSSQCAKILGIFYWPAPSHNILGARLMKELANRGHEVTFISPFSQETPIKNLREIQLTGFKERLDEIKNQMNLFEAMDKPLTMFRFFLSGFVANLVDSTLSHENVRKLLNSNETFDLIIKQQMQDDALLGLAHHFKAPVLVLNTIGASSWINRLVGNPAPPSYVVDSFLSFPPEMDFFQRTLNFVWKLISELMFLYAIRGQNDILHKYFPNAPHVEELMHNVSFVLLNSHTSFDSPIPLLPNMALVGGLHVEPPKRLPDDLQRFLDEAKEGVVYFSLGSNLRSRDMPVEKRDALVKAFSKLKMKVLWKWDDELPGKPANVKTGKWLPQQDILAHPNVKVFVTHGGLLSTIEAIYHGVPIVGIPIFGDQRANMANAERKGYGIRVPYKELSEAKLGYALDEVLHNPKYRENAKRRSQLLHDQPVKPIDNAIYWVEYVIKTEGARHLRSAALELTWYQYLLLDVVLFLTAVSFVVTLLIYIVARSLCCGKRKSKEKTN